VHTLSGGTRIVERLGPSDSDIYFHGTFSGPDAEARVRAMDDLRVTGRVVWLTWESFRYEVIVKTFLADYQSPWWISYQVSCLVVHQTAAVAQQSRPQRALVAADLGYALAAITGTAIQLRSLIAALAAENVLAPGAADQSCAVAAVESSTSAIDQHIAWHTHALESGFGQKTEATEYEHLVAKVVESAGLLAAAVKAKAYVRRIGRRLALTGG
jgi:hypothetical protein